MTAVDDTTPAAVSTPRRVPWRVLVVVAIVIAALGFLLLRVGDAAVYFKTADEAVAQRAEIGTRRFRVEGVVVAGSVKTVGDGVAFEIEERNVRLAVEHRGDPPELFQPGIPVVLEGRWQNARFSSDRIMVKHSAEYRAENPDRVPAGGP